MCEFNTGSGSVNYDTVRQAMNGRPFAMSLTDTDEIRVVIAAVDQGIDSHLEACFCPGRGDRYQGGKRKAGKLILCQTLECSVSPESLPVLLRRLCESELGGDTDLQIAAMSLVDDILMVLGFNQFGNFVGREALGLA
jgi:hypothetical protein